MRRLLELGTLLLLLTTLLTPVSEMLDRWDAPGLANDTEMHLFALVLVLALVLLVARMISSARHLLLALTNAGRVAATTPSVLPSKEGDALGWFHSSPGLSPPLRI